MVQLHLADAPETDIIIEPQDNAHDPLTNTIKKRKHNDAFIALLAQIYGQKKRACYWNILDPMASLEQPREINAKTLLSCVTPCGETARKADCFITALELPNGFRTESLEIAAKHITADLSRCANNPHILGLNALAMVLTASANANMRRHGVVIEADSPQEEAALYAACHYIGLRVAQAPKIEKDILQAAQNNMAQCWEQFKSGTRGKTARLLDSGKAAKDATDTDKGAIKKDKASSLSARPISVTKAAIAPHSQDDPVFSTADYNVSGHFDNVINVPAENITLMDDTAYGRTYKAHPDSCPHENSPHKKIAPQFNAHAIGDDIAARLEALSIDTALYKKIRQHVVETQDARRETLKKTFAKEGLTTRHITPVVQTLDMEGITSPQKKPGQSRHINFQPDGLAKPV